MAKISLFILVALICVSTASSEGDLPGTIRNSLIEQQVLALLETLRETMLTGSGDIPVLDPLQVEHLHIDEDLIDIPGARVTIKDLVLHYLSTFIVDDLNISLSNLILLQYSVQFEAHIPILVADAGEYDLFISAMSYDIFGRGDGKYVDWMYTNIVELVEPKISGSFTFRVWSMSISNMVINMGLSKFEPQLTGLFYHDGASNFANSFLANLVPELLIFYQDDISAFISPIIQDLANQLLEDVSIGDLFPQFQSIPNPTDHNTRI